MTWLGDALAWPGWAGVQGVASLIGVGSILAVAIDYRQRVRESAVPGVGFGFDWIGGAEDGPGATGVTVTMTARRGIELYDVAVMTWDPRGTKRVVPEDGEWSQPAWSHDDGPLRLTFNTMPEDENGDRIDTRVGVLGSVRTAFGWRLTGFRIALDPEATRQQWHRWAWWQWRWWPRAKVGRWVTPRPVSDRMVTSSPWLDPGL